MKEIERLKKCKPKEFWKYFKSKPISDNAGISINTFKEYFANLSNDLSNCYNEEAEYFCRQHDFNNLSSFNTELDQPITVSEIRCAVKSLKRNKTPGNDQLLNEYFVECIDILASHLCDIFNGILNSGYYPASWMEGLIIPLHKKGDKSEVNNYRGITLLSCLSKLFTTVLNKRIEKFCTDNNSISDAQFGFRKGRSTVDPIFILHSLVQKYLNENKRLYVIYVDMMKCFDSIYRNALWLKMFKTGIDGKLLRIVKDMYQKVKSCVKVCSSYSEYFNYAVGLRQGEVMSPLLFSLFVEDLELYLQCDIDAGLSIDDLTLILLLFADDMAIIGKTPEETQRHLDLLFSYCNTWGLTVNTSKTKIMVFRKRGALLANEKWTYNSQPIEVVDDFNYLGTVLNYTGNFCKNIEHLNGKALKALNVLFCKCDDFDLSPKTLCQLFDAFVTPILNYSCEVWGYTKSKELERIHLKFCKRLLRVKSNSCSAAVYGELGRYPLYIHRYIRIIKYWFKIKDSDNIILSVVYNEALKDCINGKKNWVSNVKKLLNDYGFAYVFENGHYVNTNTFLTEFKCRVLDCFKQHWLQTLESPVLILYKEFKLSFEYEKYLDVLPKSLRFYFCRLRMSCHPLRIQTGRYINNRIAREERYCSCCNSRDIEDEYHFMLICPCYNDIRKKYIKSYYYQRPSVYKFLSLMRTCSKKDVIKLSVFVKEALFTRKSLLNVVHNTTS